jgi:hypothetical protein
MLRPQPQRKDDARDGVSATFASASTPAPTPDRPRARKVPARCGTPCVRCGRNLHSWYRPTHHREAVHSDDWEMVSREANIRRIYPPRAKVVSVIDSITMSVPRPEQTLEGAVLRAPRTSAQSDNSPVPLLWFAAEHRALSATGLTQYLVLIKLTTK